MRGDDDKRDYPSYLSRMRGEVMTSKGANEIHGNMRESQ